MRTWVSLARSHWPVSLGVNRVNSTMFEEKSPRVPILLIEPVKAIA